MPHLHLILILADDEVVGLQCLNCFLLFVSTGGEDSHLQGSRLAFKKGQAASSAGQSEVDLLLLDAVQI